MNEPITVGRRPVNTALALVTMQLAILKRIEEAFAACAKPDVFCDPAHCEECADHNATLLAHDRSSISLNEVGNPAWDPITFASPEGIAYYFPSLARLALEQSATDLGSYADQLLTHLYNGYTHNKFYTYCSPSQRAAVAALLGEFIELEASSRRFGFDEAELLRAHTLWAES